MAKKPEKPTIEEIPIKLEGAHIRLKIDPEQVNKTIAAAILASGIGDRVKHCADEFLNNPKTGYGDVGLQKAVSDEMTKLVIELCQETEIRDLMKEQIKAAITEGIIDQVVKASLENTMQHLQRRY